MEAEKLLVSSRQRRIQRHGWISQAQYILYIRHQ